MTFSTFDCRLSTLVCSLLTADRLLHLAGQFRERRGVARRDIGQDFPVEQNSQLLQPVDELAIGKVVEPCRGADADDPEAAEIALALAPTAISKAARAVRGLLHEFVELAFTEEVAFGLLGELLPTEAGDEVEPGDGGVAGVGVLAELVYGDSVEPVRQVRGQAAP